MANTGYSIRKCVNYFRGKDGQWKGHSMAVIGGNGYTAKYPTIEAAEAEARRRMDMHPDEDAEGYWQYAKIYQGNTFVKLVER